MARGLPGKDRQRGSTMLEALVTIFLVAFGFMGLAALQLKMHAAEMESYQRSQALLLLDDMAARVSANRANAVDYVTADPVGTGVDPGDCAAAAVGAPRDLCEWAVALRGETEFRTVGASRLAIGGAIDGRGCIERLAGVDPPSYRVVVTWQGLTPTSTPSFDCAAGLYGGDDGLRRAVAKVVSIANLFP